MGDVVESDHKRFSKVDQATRTLSRLRCLEACIDCISKNAALPAAITFIPQQVVLKSPCTVELTMFKEPKLKSATKSQRFTSKHLAFVNGSFEYNKDGLWAAIVKITMDNKTVEIEDKYWLLLCNFNPRNLLFSFLIHHTHSDEDDDADEDLLIESSWQELVDRTFLPFGKKDLRAESILSSSPSYQTDISSWSQQHDEQLCQMMEVAKSATLDMNNIIDSVKVSSAEESKNNLLSSKDDELWESQTSKEHFIEIKVKPGIFIEFFGLKFHKDYMSYLPASIVVTGGTSGNMTTLMERVSDSSYNYPGDELWLLKNQKTYIQCIKIAFVMNENYEYEQLRISGLLLIPQKSEFDCFNFFNISDISLYPKLENVEPEYLYKRACVLKRLMHLYDSCLLYIYPSWSQEKQPIISQKIGQHMQHLFHLSSLRKILIKFFLESSASQGDSAPYVSINRHLVESLANAQIVDAKETIFYQIYSQTNPLLKPSVYRFPPRTTQWWICIFVDEGVSDSGGGFRDTLTNIAEELCPSPGSKNKSVFSLFIPSPNQRNPEASDKDSYIPNGSCKEFKLYKWIGMLLGGCLRTSENLALSLPKLFWKMLMGYEATWKDYSSVDEKEVTELALIEKIDKTMFESYCLDTRSWGYVVASGSVVELKKGGENVTVQYEDRLEYIKLAKEARLQEFKAQVDAMREGFFESVPPSVVHLMSLSELEERVCGIPTVSVEDLKKHVSFKYFGDKQQLKLFWEVMEKLTNEERSLFLKFASGRRRLPVSIAVHHSDLDDSLPTSATCSSSLYLPRYSSLDKALKMMRYAISACHTIDTDTN